MLDFHVFANVYADPSDGDGEYEDVKNASTISLPTAARHAFANTHRLTPVKLTNGYICTFEQQMEIKRCKTLNYELV